MAQPPPYDRSYNFHDYQGENPLKPLPADKLDEEFSRVKTTIDAVLQNLALIQRDDTALANKSVGYDQLKDEIQLGFNPPTDWTANHNYVVRDTVFVDVSIYRCLVSHISSNDFEDDLNAGYWELVVDFASVQTTAIAARDAALQAQADAEDARDDALQAQADAELARDAAIGAKNDAVAAKTASESARDASVVAKGLAEAAQAGAEQAQADAEAAQQAAEDARDDAIAAKNLAEGFKDDAEAAKTASESARDASVVAKGLAEAAQQAAEDARDDALQAQADAESARDDAVVARGGAESARDAAVDAKNAAEDAQADAEAAQLASENARDAAVQAKNDAEGFKDDAESAASDAQDALSTAQSIYANMSGGQTGQFLMKQSNDDYDYTWGDVAGDGIMLSSIYDPNGVEADAFNMDNMVEGASNKILTAAERTAIAANTSARHSHSNKSILDATEQAFTTALKNKLDGIEAGAQVNAVDSVAGKTGAVTLSASDISGLGNAATRDVGTTTGTVAAGDDSRITGALQASANLADLTDTNAARANIGVAQKQSSAFDATSGRGLVVGAFGLGRASGNSISNFADVAVATGFYQWHPNAANIPSAINNTYGSAIVFGAATGSAANGNWLIRLLVPTSGEGFYWQRSVNGSAWSEPKQIWHAGNLSTPTLEQLGGVPTSRSISTGTGLTGGGNLTANRTLSVDSTVWRDGNRPSAAQIGAAVAQLGHNVVGSLVFAYVDTGNVIDAGSTCAGSILSPAAINQRTDSQSVNSEKSASSLSGTWRVLGYVRGSSNSRSVTLLRRIS